MSTNRELAKELWDALERTGEEMGISEIERVLDAKDAERVPKGSVLCDDGVVRKVLGTLSMTVEGDVIGDGAYCWFMLPGVKGRDDDRPARAMYKPMPIHDPDAYTFGSRRVHSTREAAEAAHPPHQPTQSQIKKES